MINEIEKLLARREKLLREIRDVPLWVNGSVVETVRKARGGKVPFYYLSQSIKGKNKITYISAAHLKKFKEAAMRGTKMKGLHDELGAIGIALIKAGYSHD